MATWKTTPMPPEAEAPYEVGYRKPPLETRFRKGESGNARGRPKKEKTIRAILRKIAAEIVTAKLPTGEKQIGVLEFVLRTLVQRAAKGDNRATSQFIELMLNAFGIGENDDVKRDVSAEDQALVRAAVKMLGSENDENG